MPKLTLQKKIETYKISFCYHPEDKENQKYVEKLLNIGYKVSTIPVACIPTLYVRQIWQRVKL
ncbi:hypothetical protein J4418_03155 [Candidatus Woesearchaeota archaeon]|nr:hypothetical protein [Candidatus Woesearchaeota archaeon]